MKRRTLLTALPFVAGTPLLAAQRKPLINSCSQGVEFAPSRLGIETVNPIIAASPELLNQQLEITCSMMAPFIRNRRQAELGFTVNEQEVPGLLTQIGGNLSLLTHYFQSSGVAGEIDAALREHGRLGFYQLVNPSVEQVEGVSSKLAEYNVDLPQERVRQLLTVSLPNEEMLALNAFLASGGSTVELFLEGAGLFYQEANRLRSTGLSLPPAFPRGRATLPTTASLSGENRRKANKVIAGMVLVAAAAGAVCWASGVATISPAAPAAGTLALASCSTAAVVGVLAAGLRFAIS